MHAIGLLRSLALLVPEQVRYPSYATGGKIRMGSCIYGVVVIDESLYSRFYGSTLTKLPCSLMDVVVIANELWQKAWV